ncbi:MAG: DUF305 domain-containing protein [Acidobacteria bacterium]|nr:DUF305 domain-containing protein [Acidobacteriota bacterium]
MRPVHPAARSVACVILGVTMPTTITRLIALGLVAAAAAACRSASVAGGPGLIQPGAPGQEGRTVSVADATDLSKVRFTPADVRFMQGMIGHHQQAIEMAALLPSRTSREDMKLLGKRIDVSQVDEIRMMQDWLRARGQTLPDPHAHHQPGATLMPGMLTQEEMARLEAATGVAFDRLFLEGMIKHHAGALTMVRELFAEPGAGQDGDIFAFASDVEADQQMEIDRMGALLRELQR